MDRTERFYKIDQLLTERRLLTFKDLLAELEVSPATLKRDLDYMRSRLHAPIIWDRGAGGYRFEKVFSADGGAYELPGLWFSAQEIHALLTRQHLLTGIDAGGLLGPHVAPLLARLEGLLGSAEGCQEEIRKRVKILGATARRLAPAHFAVIGSALIRRQRLRLRYFARSTGDITAREVSPQRLVHYRENWYLDAWCHTREAVRSFSVDAIEQVQLIDVPAHDVDAALLDLELGAGYGIFSGATVQWATLRFSAERARWVASEQWHPQQKSEFDTAGRYVLQIPYADHRELLMDVLKYGAAVEVLAPERLRGKVREEVECMRRLYANQEALTEG